MPPGAGWPPTTTPLGGCPTGTRFDGWPPGTTLGGWAAPPPAIHSPAASARTGNTRDRVIGMHLGNVERRSAGDAGVIRYGSYVVGVAVAFSPHPPLRGDLPRKGGGKKGR